ncbi:MAG: glycosyltransferase [Candidatus Limnocylindrales bacterium]
MTDDPRDPNAPRTIVFFPEGAHGPTNNCIGIGDVLRRRGHRVVFVVEESFAGRLTAHGFEERLMRLGPPPETEEVAGQFWIDFIRDTAPVFQRSTRVQLDAFIRPTWQALVDGARYVEPRLREILAEVHPDVVVEDNVVGFPAVVASGAPWVRIVSCNPAELKDPLVPPVFSGLPAGDGSAWADFREEYRRTHGELWADFDGFMRASGAPGLPELEFIHESPWLDLYVYPAEADYLRSRPLGAPWHRLDACVRGTDAPWSPPASLAGGPGRLIYLSLGSLGSADVALLQRLVDLLGRTEHRAIVSMGPLAGQLRLPANTAGEAFLPQTSVLPAVDLVITHGGNNTVTESFYFGKPMLVLPLFWDQYDNAQRVAETGFGGWLPTYEFGDETFLETVERLLADEGLAARLAAVSARLRANPGTVRAADLIERVAVTGEPVPPEAAPAG